MAKFNVLVTERREAWIEIEAASHRAAVLAVDEQVQQECTELTWERVSLETEHAVEVAEEAAELLVCLANETDTSDFAEVVGAALGNTPQP